MGPVPWGGWVWVGRGPWGGVGWGGAGNSGRVRKRGYVRCPQLAWNHSVADGAYLDYPDH